jgi:ADP-heptose:LPS heptosyltransferase
MRGNRIFRLVDAAAGVPMLALFSLFAGISDILKKKRGEPAAVIVIKLSAMGDTVLLMPLLKKLREKHPSANIISVCTDVNIQVWENMEEVDSIIKIDVKRLFNPLYAFRLMRSIRAVRPDIVYDFDQWLRISALLAVISGAPVRAGFKTPAQHKHLGFTVISEHRRGRRHA